MSPSKILTPRPAAKWIGVSYSTFKQWILAGRIRTFTTPGGHHRISIAALEEFRLSETEHSVHSRFSSQNQLAGSVLEIAIERLAARVILSIENQRVTAIVTADAVRDLDLKPGDPAFALFKAIDVMVSRTE